MDGLHRLFSLSDEQTPHLKKLSVEDWQLESVNLTGVHSKNDLLSPSMIFNIPHATVLMLETVGP